MNYSEMSDFEINWRVFETLHGGSPDFKEGEKGAMVLISEEYDVQMGEYVKIEVVRGEFNPCNSWADAGPIIEQKKISLEFVGMWRASTYEGIEREANENPLRAAMIVFLMMKAEGEV